MRSAIACSVISVLTLAGCGGGGGGSRSGSGQGGGTPPPTPPPPPAATVAVNITTPAIDTSIGPSDTYGVAVNGTWSATNLGSGQVYLQVSDSAGTFALPAIQQATGNTTFRYTLMPASTGTVGMRNGTITIRACKDSTCSQSYTGASGSVDYRLTIDSDIVGNWEALQGSAAHNGYTPIRIDPTKLAKIWEWKASSISNERIFLGRPVTGADGVYFRIKRDSSRDGMLALNEMDGGLRWQKTIATGNFATRLAYTAGRLFFGVVDAPFGHGLVAMDARDGSTQFTSSVVRFPSSEMEPTPYKGNIFFMALDAPNGAGGLANVDAETGTLEWQYRLVPERDGFPQTLTPAIDENRAYFHGAVGLHVINRQNPADISIVPSAANAASSLTSEMPTILLGNRNNALAFFYSYQPTAMSFLSSYNIAAKTLEWTTPLDYALYPAVAKGVIYAARSENNQVSLNALDEATGRVLWTWAPPAADAQVEVFGNIVATRNLVFFSTANPYLRTGRTWAIDLATHQQAWSHPTSGQIAISSRRTLYLVPGDSVIAFKTD